jgi:hypothetical protein
MPQVLDRCWIAGGWAAAGEPPYKKSGLVFERYNERRRHGVWVCRSLDVEAFVVRKCGGLRDGGGATHPDLDDERSDRFRGRKEQNSE